MFGVIQKPSGNASPVIVKDIYMNLGNGYEKRSNATQKLTAISSLLGYYSKSHGAPNFFINGLQVNQLFSIVETSTNITFAYTGDISKFTQPFTFKVEI